MHPPSGPGHGPRLLLAELTEYVPRLARDRKSAECQVAARCERLADLPIAVGAMQLATPPCRRSGLLFGAHRRSVSNALFRGWVAQNEEGPSTQQP
jgi:hypothetical protein